MNQAHTDTHLDTYTCKVCQTKGVAFQLAVYDGVEFFGCQNCGSITSTPLPTQEQRDTTLNASHYSTKGGFPHNREKAHFIKHLNDLKAMSKGTRFLDVFCRNGYRCELARMAGFKDMTGIDTNRFCIETAEKRFHKSSFLQETLETHAQSQQTYDVVSCYHALEQALDPDQYLADLAKLMTQDSFLYLSQTDGNHFMLPNKLLRWKEIYYPERTHYMSKKGLESLLKRNGFKIVKRYFRFLPYQHIIAKRVNA